jgi:hypothetical protein
VLPGLEAVKYLAHFRLCGYGLVRGHEYVLLRPAWHPLPAGNFAGGAEDLLGPAEPPAEYGPDQSTGCEGRLRVGRPRVDVHAAGVGELPRSLPAVAARCLLQATASGALSSSPGGRGCVDSKLMFRNTTPGRLVKHWNQKQVFRVPSGDTSGHPAVPFKGGRGLAAAERAVVPHQHDGDGTQHASAALVSKDGARRRQLRAADV